MYIHLTMAVIAGMLMILLTCAAGGATGTSNPCGAPQSVRNAAVVVNTTASPFVTAVYTCDATQGYVLRGNGTIVCLTVSIYSVWSSTNFTCHRVQCQGYLQLDNTTTSTDYVRKIVTSRSCSYYDRNYGRNGCSYYKYVVYNTTYTPKNVYYGGHVNVTCRDGYRFSDSINKTKITCDANGQWIYPNKTCQPKDCGPTASVEGVNCDETSTVYPTRANCKCAAGYERNVSSGSYLRDSYGNRVLDRNGHYMYSNITANSYHVNCTSAGTWSNPDDSHGRTCSRIRCGVPPVILQGTRIVRGHYVNNTASYICDVGFSLYGNSTIYCQHNRTWSAAPQCHDTNNPCRSPPDVANATVTINTNSPLVTAVYTCDSFHGYAPRGNDTITCVKVSNYSIWSAVSFTCKRVQCQGHLQVDNTTTSTDYIRKLVTSRRCSYYDRNYGQNGCSYYRYVVYNTTYTPKNVYYGGHVNVTCRDGYHFSDNTTNAKIGCDANGQWILSNKSCQAKDCGPTEHFKGSDCDETSTVYPTRLKCKCAEGYERNVSSGSYLRDSHGNVLRDRNGQYMYSNITANNFNISCMAAGVWSKPDITSNRTCSRVICQPPQIAYSETNRTVVRGLRYGDTLTYFCMNGYDNETSTTITCQANKTWSAVPRCIVKDCGSPPATPNGHIKAAHVERTTVGATVQYECNAGFEIMVTSYSRCGEEGKWSAVPMCQRIRCGPPPSISKGRRLVGGHYYNDTTTYQCDVGYVLSGNSTIYCHLDGHWTASPECYAVSCGTPPTVSHATYTAKSGFQFSHIIDYHCSTGYNLSGDIFVTCLPDGNWSTPPTCVLLVTSTQSPSTSPFHQSTNQSTLQISTKAASTVRTTQPPTLPPSSTLPPTESQPSQITDASPKLDAPTEHTVESSSYPQSSTTAHPSVTASSIAANVSTEIEQSQRNGGGHNGFTIAVTTVAAIAILLLLVILFWYIVKIRKQLGHNMVTSFAFHNPLYKREGDTVDLFPPQSEQKVNEEQPSTDD